MEKRNKKIVLIANTGFTVINFRKEFIQNLIRLGADVIVICPSKCTLSEGRNLSEEFATLGARHIAVTFSRSGINPISEMRLFVDLYRKLRKEKPDIVLNYTIKPTIYGSLAAKFSGVTVIASNITGLGYIFTDNSIKSTILSFIIKTQYKLALRYNNIVFFQNPDDKNFFISLSLLQSRKAKVINGSGVDTKRFKRINNRPKPSSFILVARMLWDKGINEFIGAAKILKLKYPDAIFTLLGPVDDNPNSLTLEDLQPYIQQGIVQYIAAKKDVRKDLEEHEVFVLPSYREGTPRSILEAMSMSMPIVTTDVPGCRETVVSGSNGYLVQAKDILSLAYAMEKFITERSLVCKFGKCSRKLACDRYEISQVNQSIISEIL